MQLITAANIAHKRALWSFTDDENFSIRQKKIDKAENFSGERGGSQILLKETRTIRPIFSKDKKQIDGKAKDWNPVADQISAMIKSQTLSAGESKPGHLKIYWHLIISDYKIYPMLAFGGKWTFYV